MALDADTHLRAPRGIVVRVVIVGSDVDQSDIPAVHIHSSLESYVEARGCDVEKEGGPVAHPDPGMVDVGLQGGNPAADHVSHLSQSVHDRIVEPGTEIVDPETPVDCSKSWTLVIWDAGNSGFDPGSLPFLEAESWACQVSEIVVPVAGK